MTELFADKTTLDALGWPHILAALASHAVSLRGRELALTLPFLPDPEAAAAAVARQEEARRCLQEGSPPPLDAGDTDVRPILVRAQKNATLAAPELLACARLIDAAFQTRHTLTARRATAPHLAKLVEPLHDLRSLAHDIDAAIAPSGTLKDDASSMLLVLRQRALRLHQSIKERIDAMLQAPEFASNLQDTYYSVRGDRYVLPIVASFQSRVPGIVHNVSQTGQTVFIEPQELVPLGNALAMAQAEVDEEERRILAALSADIGDNAAALAQTVDILGQCDLVFATAHLAVAFAALPPVWQEATRSPVRLAAMRHPLLLLQGAQVVPNDIVMGADTCALVVSGPNAGGKTALLSGVGLCVLMARAGLAIPTGHPARLPWWQGVGCVLGDAQDIQRGLSSFSGHLHGLKKMVQRAAPGWLMLVDEIAADTDPHEGAALARATLEALVDAGARVLVTTHLEEIKVLALTDARFANGCVALAPDTMQPTYTLTLGSAGFSRALAVAEQVGLPSAIMGRAHALLRDAGLIASTMQRLQERESELQRQQATLDTLRRALEDERAQARTAARIAAEAVQRARADAWAEVGVEVDAARAQVRGWMKTLQAQPSMRAAHQVDKDLAAEADGIAARVQPAQGPQRLAPVEVAPPTDVTVGARVHVPHLGQDGEIVQHDADSALIAVGAMRVRVKLAALAPAVRATPPKRPAVFGDSKTAPAAVMAQGIQHTGGRCDVRGLRADDACRLVDRAMDQSLSAGQRELVIVHGLGSGALRASIRELLSHSPYVSTFRPGKNDEGGEGVTVVELTVA